MLFDSVFDPDSPSAQRRVERLENFHKQRYSYLLWILLAAFAVFVIWASLFQIDQVARATGEVIASSRVQVIQAVDGGVLAEINVKEGDKVEPGQVLARFETERIGASVREIEARLCALKIKRTRLLAEVTEAETLTFAGDLNCSAEQIELEAALFEQRREGLQGEIDNLKNAVQIAAEEVRLIRNLARSGDTNRSEMLRARRQLNDTQAKIIVRENRFFEEANSELTRVEDEIGQNEQVLKQRREQLEDSVFVAQVLGIVKNIAVTTVGGVLRSGEELMQIIPVDDELIVEAKVSPVDIALVRPGLDVTLRFDPYDYTIFGGVAGKVRYVSADTLKEETARGEEIYYRVHVAISSNPVVTTTGTPLEIQPGMTAQADIRTGQRTVMEYLLKPLRKTLSTAFGER